MSDYAKITPIMRYPLRSQHNFRVDGELTDVTQACARDYAAYPHWDYYILESSAYENVWFVWQVKKGGPQPS